MSTDSHVSTSDSLLMRVRDLRDADAWGEFAALYGPLIRGYAAGRGLQAADADDLTQDVLAKVARALPDFRYEPARGRFRAWLGTVTRNELRAFWAGQGRRPAVAGGFPGGAADDLPGAAGPDPGWEAAFTAHVLAAACERVRGEFEPATWAVFEAVWVGKDDPVAVADRHGVAVHAVYVGKSRVLKRLRAEVLALAEDMPHALPAD